MYKIETTESGKVVVVKEYTLKLNEADVEVLAGGELYMVHDYDMNVPKLEQLTELITHYDAAGEPERMPF